ncbi:extensin-like [Ailuropoda melanoleuca]|uniref:extensin-like n=1 Tax=Ailuropoda melanoleuca TaxID=9646 RepID=UPI00149418AB|nr:extensin-like [Ailuropoda melanoleuca]
MEGCRPCLTPSAKLPSRSALRGRPGTRRALPPPAAPGPPPPAPGSLSPTPTPTTLPCPPSDKRDNLLPSCRSRRPRSKATASGNHTDTITTLTSQKPQRPGPGPNTRNQTPSSFVALQRPRQRPIRSRQDSFIPVLRGRKAPGSRHHVPG